MTQPTQEQVERMKERLWNDVLNFSGKSSNAPSACLNPSDLEPIARYIISLLGPAVEALRECELIAETGDIATSALAALKEAGFS